MCLFTGCGYYNNFPGSMPQFKNETIIIILFSFIFIDWTDVELH